MTLIVVLLAAAARPLHAVTRVWDGGGGSFLWNTPANWNPDGVPAASDDVIIGNPGETFTVVLSGSATAATLHLEAKLSITAGSNLTLGGPSLVNGTINLEGSITGAGDLAIAGILNWTGSTSSSLAGSGRITITNTGVLNKSGRGPLNRNLDNYGYILTNSQYSPGVEVWFLGNVILNNFGTFEWWVTTGGSLSFSAGSLPCAFNNLGTLLKTGGGGAGFQANNNGKVPFNNAGVVDVQQGSLQIGTGVHSGEFNIECATCGLTLGLFGHTLEPTARVYGPGMLSVDEAGPSTENFVCNGSIDLDGQLRFVRGQPVFNGPVRVGGTMRLGVNSNDNPAITFNDVVDLLPDGIIDASFTATTYFNGPLVDLAGSATASGAALYFADDVFVSRQFSWSSASLSGPGQIIITATGQMNLGGGTLAVRVQNEGTLSFGTSGTTVTLNRDVINNGLMRCEGPSSSSSTAQITAGANIPPPWLLNNGIFEKAGPGNLQLGSNLASDPLLDFENNGKIQVSQGVVQFEDGMTNNGVLLSHPGTKVQFSTTSVHTPESQINIGGELEFYATSQAPLHDLAGQTSIDGTLTIRGGTVILNNAIAPSAPVVVLDWGVLQCETDQIWNAGLKLMSCCGNSIGGVLQGSGEVRLGGASIYRGTMRGAGVTVVEPGASITTISPNGGASPRLERRLENHGSAFIDRPVTLNNGAIENHGELQFNASGNLSVAGIGGQNSVVNLAALNKTGVGILALINTGAEVVLNNNGSVNVNQGTLQLDCGAAGDGEILVNAGATLRLNSTCAAGSCIVHGTLWLSPQKQLWLAGTFQQTAAGRLKATIITPLQPSIVAEGGIVLDGAVEAQISPLPPSPVVVALLHSGKAGLSGEFASHSLTPFGRLEYNPKGVDWIVQKYGDVNGDHVVNVTDLLLVTNAWGPCPDQAGSCPADVNGDGAVNVSDLLIVINNWG